MASRQHKATAHVGAVQKWIRKGKTVGEQTFLSINQAKRYMRTGKPGAAPKPKIKSKRSGKFLRKNERAPKEQS